MMHPVATRAAGMSLTRIRKACVTYVCLTNCFDICKICVLGGNTVAQCRKRIVRTRNRKLQQLLKLNTTSYH